MTDAFPTPRYAGGRLSRAATIMGAATAVSRVLGFGRVLVIAAVLGTTDLGNTFTASNSVSNVLFDLLAAGALSAVLVPGFVELLDGRRPAGDGEAAAERLAGGLLGWSFLLLGPVCVAGVVGAPVLARVLTAATDDPAVAAEQRELAAFLLRLFVPQVLLYAYGAVATAVLHAKRRFTITAVAPIGNTVVMVAGLLAFRALHGDGPPSLDLGAAERLALGAAGTLGVAAFVGVPAVALWRTGFRLRPRLEGRSLPGLGRVARLSAWAGLQHAGTGILLGAALLVGMGVSGGVVAYQVAFACFLVPYAVFALPLITAVLPELAGDAASGDLAGFGRTLRWAVTRMTRLVVPVSVAGAVLGPGVMEALAFGQTSSAGGRLIGAALATLALGLLPYGAFLLFVRAHYALGEGRLPARVALASAVLGAALMALAGVVADGPARLAAMGGAHSVAYLAGAAVLGARLGRRTGESLLPTGTTRSLAAAAMVGLLAASALAALAPSGRAETLLASAGVAAVGGALYTAVVRAGRTHPGTPVPGGR